MPYGRNKKTGEIIELDDALAAQFAAAGKPIYATVEDAEGVAAPAAQAPAPAAPKPAPGWDETLFPTLAPILKRQGMSLLSSSPSANIPAGLDAVTGAAGRPADAREQVWPMVRDLLTMPLRGVAGAGAAMGQNLGGASGIGDLVQGIGLRRPDVSEAYRSTMSAPQAEAAAQDANVSFGLRYSANPSLFTAMANDPTTLPLLLAGKLPIGGLGQGVLAGATMAGARSLDEGEFAPSPWDALPLAIGGAASAAPSIVRFGGSLKDKAKDLIVSQIKGLKPEIADELRRGLATHLTDVVGRTTGTVGGMVERYRNLLSGIRSEYEPVVSEMERSGQKVKVGPIVSAAKKDLAKIGASRSGGTYDPSTAGRTMNWLERRVGATDDAAKFEDAIDNFMVGISTPSTVLEIGPRAAHGMQSALRRAAMQAANENDEKVIASLAAGTEAANQLKAMSPAYRDLTSRAAPIYAMKPAMEVAARRQNRNPFSLSSAVAPITTIQELPATARALWDLGHLLEGIRAPRGAVALPIFAPRDATAAR